MTTEIIIPVYRPGKLFERLLSGIFNQSVLPDKIRIINTKDEEFSANKIEEMILGAAEKIKIGKHIAISIDEVSKSKFNHAKTRDMGIKKSDADIVILMTQDAVPKDKFLIKNLLEPFYDLEIAAVYARQLPRDNAGLVQSYINLFNYPEKSVKKTKDDFEKMGIKTYFCSDVCAAYRKDVYNRTGGFDKEVIFGEDIIYSAKLINRGYAVYYAANARVVHSHNYSYMQQFRRNFDIAVSHYDNPEIFKKVSSEKEGVNLVKNTISFLLGRKAYLSAANFIIQSGFKYAGYLFGKNYKKLSKEAVLYMTSNKEYWNGKL